MKPDQTAAELINSILSGYPVLSSLFLHIGELTIELSSNSEALIENLKSYFHGFTITKQTPNILIHAIQSPDAFPPFFFQEKEPDPGKTKIKEAFYNLPAGRIVRKQLTGMYFIFDGNQNLAIGPCLANSNQIVNFVNSRFIEHMVRKGWLLAHAAGVRVNGRGLAIAGFSGMGKSSLALHLLGQGSDFVSNDRLLIGKVGDAVAMRGIPKHPRVNPGTLLSIPGLDEIVACDDREEYKNLSEDELWHLESKHDVLIHEIFGETRFGLSADVSGLAILNWQRQDRPLRIRQININGRSDLMPAFMKTLGLFYVPLPGEEMPDLSTARYAQVFSRVPVFEVSGGIDFKSAAEFFLDYLMRRV